MNNKYNHKKIEKKWQEIWAKTKLYQVDLHKSENPFYNLMMFPYPSGEYLHLGHGYSYSGADVYGRFMRLSGKNVFEPIGYDSFGLPAENYAIKAGVHPKVSIAKNIEIAREQLKSFGCMFDFEKEVVTSDPSYYKWTQWVFLKLYEHGLAYQKESPVNWCPNCKTVLANEQVINGKCERCETEVIQKKLNQWFFKITDYAEKLLKGLDDIDWPESSKIKQKNWIGKSTGVEFEMEIDGNREKLGVFTTRIDTVYGMTYVVIAPEHPLVEKITTDKQKKEIEKYQRNTQKLAEIERQSTEKEKTGVFTGAYAINPFNNKKIPIWVADYVIYSYGTGAVMAVPAHDERDFEFAKKYDLPIKESIIPKVIDKHDPPKDGAETIFRHAIQVILINPKNNKVLCLKWKKFPWTTFITGGVEGDEDTIAASKRETIEETGYIDIEYVKTLGGPVESHFYANHKGVNRKALFTALVFHLKSEKKEKISEEEAEIHELAWVTWDELHKDNNVKCAEYDIWLDRYFNQEHAFVEKGVLTDSDKYTGLTSEEAINKMAEWLEEKGIGGTKTTYRLRDWSFSRQRYWGAPIPIIYCDKCGAIPVPEEDLPVELPEIKDFRPAGLGEGPLASAPDFVNTKCPKCGGSAKRETDTMDTFVDSSFYFMRYPNVGDDTQMMNKKITQKWLPVDMYVGGAEHVTMHLLYARFVTKAFYDIGLIGFDEPFIRLRHQGMILGPDGKKMSKSKGNIVIPDEVMKKVGADAFRTYILFMGQFEDGGPWNPNGIAGISRFLEKIWRLFDREIIDSDTEIEVDRLLNKAIKKVGQDIADFKFNTAISSLMILVNGLSEAKKIDKRALGILAILLSPFAPHLAEEVWEKLGNTDSVHNQTWPRFDKKLIEDEMGIIAVQINGKVRDQILVVKGTKENDILKLAKDSEKIKKYLQNTDIIKVIYIPDKLLSLVTK
ncbi:MAG: class I tRNA ligase family protein [Patescibacteria group bacterium]